MKALSLEQEYTLVKSSAGIFDFSLEGKIKVSGEKAKEFLQGLVSNDVNLEISYGVYAAFLNRFGKILSDCFIYCFQDYFIILLPFAQKQKIFSMLKKEALLSNVIVEDITLQYALLSVQGKKAKNILEAFFQEKIELKYLYSILIKRKDIDFFIMQNKRSGLESYDLLFPAKNYQNVLQELSQKENLHKMSFTTYDILRLEAGIPLFGIDFDETTLLLELGEDAVSYTKGCYIGQEVVARIKNLAKGITPKKLVKLQIEGEEAFEKNTEIYSQDKKIGFLTSSAYSYGLKKIVALGYMQKGFYDVKEVEVGEEKKKGVINSS